ncbi:MAG TPA: poly-gamma-glutamate hydrolase family protein [Saprospiraceae bacterium]|nr:poly-gamma-glutamate hydrolase family protein [Saprospiraceae bacterium]
MKDTYKKFTDLKSNQPKDFKIRMENRNSKFLIFTPHGGGIEQGTSEICERIAGEIYSYYLFEGKGNKCKKLHITSTNFDEPNLHSILPKHKYAISVHGMTNKIKKDVSADVYLGGLNKELIMATTKILNNQGFRTSNNITKPHRTLSGTHKNSVTNKCSSGVGMQIELSNHLRAKFFEGNHKLKKFRISKTEQFDMFCDAIKECIKEFT